MQEDFYMHRFIVLLIFITHISSVMANTINSSPYFSQYPSKLKTYNTSSSTNRYYNPQRLYRGNQYRQKVYNRYCPHCHHQNYYHQPIKINNLKRLEKHVWGKSYSSEDDITRLERLENLAFGNLYGGGNARKLQHAYRHCQDGAFPRVQGKANLYCGNGRAQGGGYCRAL